MSNLRPELLKAVALHYDGVGAPKVVAKGEGLTAEEIKAAAQQNDVPLCENGPLAEVLTQIEMGESIPQSVYLAVAHIIAFAYQLKTTTEGTTHTATPLTHPNNAMVKPDLKID